MLESALDLYWFSFSYMWKCYFYIPFIPFPSFVILLLDTLYLLALPAQQYIVVIQYTFVSTYLLCAVIEIYNTYTFLHVIYRLVTVLYTYYLIQLIF